MALWPLHQQDVFILLHIVHYYTFYDYYTFYLTTHNLFTKHRILTTHCIFTTCQAASLYIYYLDIYYTYLL